MTITKQSRSTLTACELDIGDELRFVLSDGSERSVVVRNTRVKLHETDLENADTFPLQPVRHAHTVVRMHCMLTIDGYDLELVRWVGNQRSFYEPWQFMGLRIWIDAIDELFTVLTETHGPCRPRKAVRLAVQESSRRICPPLLHPWCPLPEDCIRIEDAYDSSNCWLGPYFGAEAHGGLDINHPAGTPIWAPIRCDEQGLFDAVSAGAENNRWRGVRTWDDGSTWILQVHHLIRCEPPSGAPVEAGGFIGEGAGVAVGSHEHSHFAFAVVEPGDPEEELIRLDPWILFWQMYRDRELTTAYRREDQARRG
jgi:hypothetical protein